MKFVYTNTGDHSTYPAGIEVKPGDSRELDSDQCPEFAPKVEAEPEKSDPEDPLAGLLNNSVKEIKPALETFSGEQLAKLETLELAGQARKSLLEAITEAKLKKAQESGGAGATDVQAILANTEEQILPLLDGFDLATLEALGEAEQSAEEPRLSLLQAVSDRILALQEGQ